MRAQPTTEDLDPQLLEAIRAGRSTRAQLMEIDRIRLRTWAVVNERLGVLVKQGHLVPTKTGWRLAGPKR